MNTLYLADAPTWLRTALEIAIAIGVTAVLVYLGRRR